MYLRTRTWAIISVVCFLAAFYFWQLGERRAAREQETRRGVRTNAFVPLLSTQTNVVAQSQTRFSGLIERNGPVPYRVSNTRLPLKDLTRSDAAVLLRNALIDATSGVELPIPEHLRLKGETKSHVVQSRGTITEDFRAALKAAGAEIVSYVPNNAYLVRVNPEQAQSLRGLPQVQSVMAWEPHFKIVNSKLLALAFEQQPLPDGNPLVVMAFPGEEEATAQALRDLGGSVMRKQSSPFGTQLLVYTPPDKLVEVAQLDTVQAIEPAYRRVLANDLSRTRVGISTNTVVPKENNHLGLTGAGVVVGVNDTGVDQGHPDLAGRVLLDATSSGIDLNGHGTHVAGTIISSGANSPPGERVPGSTTNASFRGMAPDASVFVQPIDIVTGPLKLDTEMQEVGASNGVFVSNNSWGYLGAFDYTFAAASWDAAVRDSIPARTGSQAVTYVFSAGNDGGGFDDGSGGFADTISAPATGKNVITVGAIEQFRNITNEIVINGETNVPFATMTDSDNQVASFSSRGNVGPGIEGVFGRFKPDVVAPGVFVVSTRANNWSGNLNLSYFPGFLTDEVVPVGQTNLYFFTTGGNSVEARIRVLPNNRSPIPFPTNSIYVRRGSPPPPSDVATNGNMLNIPVLPDETYYVGIGNNFNQDVHFDIQAVIIDVNPPSPGDQQLVQLNQALEPHYRYESGTSMSAPVVSGMLALMRQHLSARGFANPSPALMKALLINGARSLDQQLSLNRVGNDQGWGLANITNSLPLHSPAGLDQWPVRFFDQETTGLTTGQSATRMVTVSSNTGPLRITLVWTDPPGNPSVGTKLVNDLDLIVTNLNTGDIYAGNVFGGNFSSPVDATNVVAQADVVNNVENVYIETPTAGHTYSVTVKARRVNVNAVTAHDPRGVAQDYALVISSGSPAEAPTFTLNATPVLSSDPSNEIIRLTNSTPVLNTVVGANPSLWTAPNSNGFTNQWRFFVFENTNTVNNTNVAFFTFLTPNKARERQSEEADIDLYVSTDPALTNLDAGIIAASSKSRRRGGTEAVVFTNATAPTYYIGVKSEDQQAALFGLFGFAGPDPFSQRDSNGVVHVNGLGVPVDIPDGSSDSATPVYVFGYCMEPIQIQNIVVTNTLAHESGGDLVGVLEHNGRQAVLNNHRGFQATNPPITFIYDDSDSGQIPDSTPTDPPGTLRNFWGEEGQGTWQLTMVDNALTGVGRIVDFDIRLEPTQNTNDNERIITILPNRWFFTVVDVPQDAISLKIDVVPSPGPVDMYVGRNYIPDDIFYDHFAQFDPNGGTLEITRSSVPPLAAGLYFIGLRNPNSFPITVRLRIRVERNLLREVTNIYSSTGPIPLRDDAVTTSLIPVTNAQEVVDVRVGVRIAHERASDLVVSLVSPAGTRVILSENRGGDSRLGYGGGSAPNFIHTIFTDNTNLTTTPIKFGDPPFTNSGCVSAQIIAYEVPSGTVGNQNLSIRPQSLGMDFDVNSTISISSLGVFDSGSDGLAGPLRAHIYNRVTQTSLARVDFTPSNPGTLIDGSRFHALSTELILPEGFPGTIVVDYLTSPTEPNGNKGSPGAGNWTTNSGDGLISFVGSARTTVSGVGYPDVQDGGPANRYAAGTFIFSAAANTPRVSYLPAGSVFFSGFEDTRWPCPEALVGTSSAGDPNTFVDGWFVAAASVDLICNSSRGRANSGEKWLELNGTSAGRIYRSVDTVPGENYLLTFAYSKNPLVTNAEANIEINLQSNATVRYSFPNSTNNLDWQIQSTLFRAPAATMTLGFRSRTPGNAGMYLDNVQLIPVRVQTNMCNYFLPEEALREMRGENAYGNWRLEIWDNRVGAPVGQLLDWQVDFDFPPPPIPTTVVTNSVCNTNTLVGDQVRYFRVDVPINATRATNEFVSSRTINMGVDLVTLPVGSSPPDDYPPVIGVNGTLIISTASSPPLRPGRPYFVGLRNTVPFNTNGAPVTNDFTFCVNFDAGPTNDISAVVPLTNDICFASSIEGTNAISYYMFDASTNAVAVFFDLVSLTGNADLFVKQGFPLPFPGNSLESRNTGTTSEHIAIGSGQISGRWFIGVLNNDNTNVSYTLCAKEITNYVTITNDLCVTNVPLVAGKTDYYRFTISNHTGRAEFRTFNANGDINLYVRQAPPAGEFSFDYASANVGTGDESIVVDFTSSPVPLTPGDWYAAVVNRDIVDVNYCIEVKQYPFFDPNEIRLFITNGWTDVPPPERYMDLTIVGPDYFRYQIEYSNVLTDDPTSWKPLSDTNGVAVTFGPGSTSYTYRDTPLTEGNPPGLVRMRFYRVVVVP